MEVERRSGRGISSAMTGGSRRHKDGGRAIGNKARGWMQEAGARSKNPRPASDPARSNGRRARRYALGLKELWATSALCVDGGAQRSTTVRCRFCRARPEGQGLFVHELLHLKRGRNRRKVSNPQRARMRNDGHDPEFLSCFVSYFEVLGRFSIQRTRLQTCVLLESGLGSPDSGGRSFCDWNSS
ncbi:hypothetical protein EYF80_062988 [Liparis tanakae]|uniref:Uncharacterized protein n=1 Tax=Liparis tanakae TaxID=230148 RepID=A0A4Z2EE95_9TELE|nr:hypothetical protein EYF80_062988 [Liparis tanakae]